MTPRQMVVALEAADARAVRQHNLGIKYAWLSAYLRRSRGRPIPLRQLQLRARDQQQQSPEQMKAILKQWVIAMGGRVLRKEEVENVDGSGARRP